MMNLRVGYVREHFSSPLLQFAEVDDGKTFNLVECPSGTGQLISRLTNDEIDIAIALTDPLISGIANGSTAYKLVGSFVSTPLNWAVITGVNSEFQDIKSLKGTTLGISRPGSGSQTMAHVMALQQGWSTGDFQFKVNNDIHGLIASVDEGSTSAFMWEHFTTKPFVDEGKARFIGNVPTPWPSWLIAAHPTRAPNDQVKAFLSQLTDFVNRFASTASRLGPNIDFIKEKFGYPEEDIKAWLGTVGYPLDCAAIPHNVVEQTFRLLEKAGVVKMPENGFDVNVFVNKDVCSLTP
ncbi:periplasmic binding protein-like II [Pterulicium gracile]|uniref:Periplasmic binding protein-like II n=1 Tax=Pterulicium gracile TaxID=1884261 RepID=A0A5C3QP81_9AGAR|nr:periplasmic binding protein-like II [Pterula gracilis]